MSVSNNLKREMKAKDNMSQYKLADLSGVPQPTIQRILKGSDPKAETVKKLAAAMEISTSKLLDDVEFESFNPAQFSVSDLNELMPTASPKTYQVLQKIKVAAESGQLTDEDIGLLDVISRRLASDQGRSDS